MKVGNFSFIYFSDNKNSNFTQAKENINLGSCHNLLMKLEQWNEEGGSEIKRESKNCTRAELTLLKNNFSHLFPNLNAIPKTEHGSRSEKTSAAAAAYFILSLKNPFFRGYE